MIAIYRYFRQYNGDFNLFLIPPTKPVGDNGTIINIITIVTISLFANDILIQANVVVATVDYW